MLSSQASTISLVDALFPVQDSTRKWIRDGILVLGFALFTALLARVSIPLGFTPVPITGQTLAVLLTGAALGSRRGASSMTLYLVAGSWLPIYAGGGSGFVWDLASGGYIVGYIPAAYVIGFLCERGWDRRVRIILAMLAGNIVLYIPGLIWLAFFVPVGKVLELGLYPFIPGDLIKLGIASVMLPTAWGMLRWSKGTE